MTWSARSSAFSRSLALGLWLTACSDSEPPLPPLEVPDVPGCDPLVPEHCAMPFPSSFHLEEDASRVTGFTLAYGAATLPANLDGVHIDPAPYRRLDGFGVGQPAVVYFPRLDASKLPDETRIAESLEPSSPVALFKVSADGAFERLPCFAESDLTDPDPEHRALLVRPAVLLEEGTRYVVALRGLVDVDGAPIPPSDAFIALRDGRSGGTSVANRQARFDAIFAGLEAAGIPRADLTLAFDWVTASSEALHGPLLHMRDDALAMLGDARPAITVTTVNEFTVDESPDIAFEVEGTYSVPHYLVPVTIGNAKAYRLDLGPDGLPRRGDSIEAGFLMRVPRSALPVPPATKGEAHGAFIHGHGLNGSYGQVRDGWMSRFANQEKFVVVGTNMLGMSSEDVDAIIAMLGDMSEFPALPDRLHQGALNHVFLGRALKRGFDAIPELASRGVTIDPKEVYYNGISQGGIFGATHLALSPDITRGQLGVPGNNYASLLQRSTDFGPFFIFLKAIYADPHDRQVLISLIQGLWDAVDPVSHYRHVSANPHPNTPAHSVLLASATGDYQVALVTNEVVTRSDVGVALLPGYGKEVPLVTPVTYPHQGSGLVNYSFGNPWPAPGNLPPGDDLGDPHGKPRNLDHHNKQMAHFWRTGEIIDVCGDDGCTPN
ncbi:MAG: hypothetical protein FJ096_04195 [Deltaproteobacteria bacterium]|nr:hypothetical protein [Deltaproteobacteria bacterium]